MRALADTSILIALVKANESAPDLTDFDEGIAVSALTWSELAVGLHTTSTASVVRSRMEEYGALRSLFTVTLPYDDSCATAYFTILSRVVDRGGEPKARPFDRMIAATALANDLPLVTRNAVDFAQLDKLIRILER